MDPKWVHMEAEGRPNGGLGAKPPEKRPLGPIGPYWALLALLDPFWTCCIDFLSDALCSSLRQGAAGDTDTCCDTRGRCNDMECPPGQAACLCTWQVAKKLETQEDPM